MCKNIHKTYKQYVIISHLLIQADNFKATFMISESVFCIITFIYLQAKEAESRGDLAKARQKRNAAIFCNIQACVWWVMITLILTIVPFVAITTRCATCSDQSP